MAFSKKINIDKTKIDLSKTKLKDVIELCNASEQYVLLRKYGLLDGEITPMQQIGNEFDMSRERIRQIMNKSLIKVRRFISHNEKLNNVIQLVHKLIKDSGNLVGEEYIINKLLQNKEINLNYNELLLVLSSDYDLYYIHRNKRFDKMFFVEPIFEDLINDIHDTSIKNLKQNKGSVDKDKFIESLINTFSSKFERNESLKTALTNKTLYQNIFNLSRDIYEFEGKMGLENNKEANPKTMKLKIQYVLNLEKKSMHYEEVAKLVKETFNLPSIKVPTIHNELVKGKEFVNVGMGTYGLKSWGFKGENTLEAITNILKEANRPMKVSEITKEVLKERTIREVTILIVLQKNEDVFERVGKGLYKLK